ncbi:hypothetical protein AAG570_005060 [Ranatra chinensis]|uniref:Uncharacterized protein n=1 Tax=Ranatra chinensis TaxID=642074 RepID=A0ABD0XZP1_9HEMI
MPRIPVSKFPNKFQILICGNGLHAKCMTVLAERQTSGSDLPAWKHNPMLRCPICRGDFGTKRELRDAASKSAASLSSQQPLTLFVHPMASCKFCLKGPPLYGNLYKCLACPQGMNDLVEEATRKVTLPDLFWSTIALALLRKQVTGPTSLQSARRV